MRYEPVVLGFNRTFCVKDLTAKDRVQVSCGDCGRGYWVASHVYYARYHEHLPLDRIARDYKCRTCGNRQLFFWRVERAIGPQFPKAYLRLIRTLTKEKRFRCINELATSEILFC